MLSNVIVHPLFITPIFLTLLYPLHTARKLFSLFAKVQDTAGGAAVKAPALFIPASAPAAPPTAGAPTAAQAPFAATLTPTAASASVPAPAPAGRPPPLPSAAALIDQQAFVESALPSQYPLGH